MSYMGIKIAICNKNKRTAQMLFTLLLLHYRCFTRFCCCVIYIEIVYSTLRMRRSVSRRTVGKEETSISALRDSLIVLRTKHRSILNTVS